MKYIFLFLIVTLNYSCKESPQSKVKSISETTSDSISHVNFTSPNTDDEATAKKNAATIVAFEKSLATPMMTKEERRDTRKMYNPMTVAELTELAPAIDWEAHLKGIGVTDLDKIIVTDLGYFKALSGILDARSVEDIKLLFRWNTINNSLGLLSTDLETANWEFYSKEMRGAKQQRPRNERALGNLNGAVGEALGKLYVDKMFPPKAKAKAKPKKKK